MCLCFHKVQAVHGFCITELVFNWFTIVKWGKKNYIPCTLWLAKTCFVSLWRKLIPVSNTLSQSLNSFLLNYHNTLVPFWTQPSKQSLKHTSLIEKVKVFAFLAWAKWTGSNCVGHSGTLVGNHAEEDGLLLVAHSTHLLGHQIGLVHGVF